MTEKEYKTFDFNYGNIIELYNTIQTANQKIDYLEWVKKEYINAGYPHRKTTALFKGESKKPSYMAKPSQVIKKDKFFDLIKKEIRFLKVKINREKEIENDNEISSINEYRFPYLDTIEGFLKYFRDNEKNINIIDACKYYLSELKNNPKKLRAIITNFDFRLHYWIKAIFRIQVELENGNKGVLYMTQSEIDKLIEYGRQDNEDRFTNEIKEKIVYMTDEQKISYLQEKKKEYETFLNYPALIGSHDNGRTYQDIYDMRHLAWEKAMEFINPLLKHLCNTKEFVIKQSYQESIENDDEYFILKDKKLRYIHNDFLPLLKAINELRFDGTIPNIQNKEVSLDEAIKFFENTIIIKWKWTTIRRRYYDMKWVKADCTKIIETLKNYLINKE